MMSARDSLRALPGTRLIEPRPHPPAANADPWREAAECVEQLVALDALRADVAEEMRQKIGERRFDLVVAGQFKRGKTSLINALLGAEVLPVAVVPLTSVITLLTYGADAAATIVFESGKRRPIALGELGDYVTERGNPNNEKRVREAQVTYPSTWLAGGIRLVDTPGVGSVYRSNTDVAQRFLPKADAVLFVLSVDQPLGAAECEFLASIREYADHVFFLLNKADLLSGSELREAVEFTRGALRSALGAEPALFPISARLALQEHALRLPAMSAPSGMLQFAQALEAFLAKDKSAVLAASVGRKLARATAEASFAAELELQSLAQPLEELERKAALFRERKREMVAAREDIDMLLGPDASRALQRPFDEALKAFKETLKADVSAALGRRYEIERRQSSRELYRSLESETIRTIREGFDAWQGDQSDAIDRAFDRFCARHAERVGKTVDELYRFAADLFAVAYTAPADGGFRSTESRFHYKFWSEPPALRVLSSALQFALPRALVGRVILRRARQYAFELVEMQSGRLRYDFSQRIDEALAGFRRAMSDQVDAAITAIEAAIDRALELRRAGEAEAQLRGNALASKLLALRWIETRIAVAGPAAASGLAQAALSPALAAATLNAND